MPLNSSESATTEVTEYGNCPRQIRTRLRCERSWHPRHQWGKWARRCATRTLRADNTPSMLNKVLVWELPKQPQGTCEDGGLSPWAYES